MKFLLILISFFVFCLNPLALNAKPYNGYIITIDQKKITGKIMDIFYSDLVSEVVFMNDFGNVYNLKAGLILGFVYTKENGQPVSFESKRYKRRWFFLKLEFKGTKINAYRSPEIKSTPGNAFSGFAATQSRVNEDWIEYEGKIYKMIPIRWRKRLKKIFKNHPDIVEKLNQPDLQLRDDLKGLVQFFEEVVNRKQI